MDHREGTGDNKVSSNHAMSGANEADDEVDSKAVPSSPKLECYACGREFESEEELDIHVRRER